MIGGFAAETGEVSEFDDRVGLGVVISERGHSYSFHCTQIADGTRTIEVGTAVTYEVRPAQNGRWEAAQVKRLRAEPQADGAAPLAAV